ncbi:FAD-dependent oxidoreductase [Rhodoluna sp. KAS3]|uniref:FAD-dependent oxidoreductase n=1 Tax=Rhodoluna sp. KAS3 TaxID=942880 RepID=UPI0022309706|nr:FAD-dependent oxidoreductase [Rhodoluna sp. KAS3]BDS49625.1 pyridine nucleotide-disulfide oxidoreductase [Rhodoluna sp. KAS3]
MSKHLRVAIIGAGPAGIYAGNILASKYPDVNIDLFDSLPAPYGLIRYGVAPDHPRIKGIVNSLHEMLDSGVIRFFGNVEFGKDLTLADIRKHYHAVIFATGAIKDATLNIPGVDLEGSYGAADFVSWYDGHPDFPRTWPLNAKQVAVLGNGNVALDVARVLAKHADDMLSTDIPANVYEGLKASPVTDVHVFGRRGPAQIKFTPIELRELGELEDVDLVLYDEDFPEGWFDEDAEGVTNQHKVMARIIEGWREEEPKGASRRLHLHFFSSPVEILGTDKVEGIKFERTELNPDGSSVHGTGQFVEFPVQAVYRAIGYFGSELPEVPFDDKYGVIRNQGGRVVDEDGSQVEGLYATGWIKRGPVGLIGHTKSDATETIENLVADVDKLVDPAVADTDAVLAELKARGVDYTTWAGWLKLNEHEIALGAADTSHVERERVKVVDREEQVSISNA